MALIRGLGSHAPCPICLVPGDELANLSDDFELRSTSSMEEVYKASKDMSAAESETAFKALGLRDIEVLYIQAKCLRLNECSQ